ncbi:MAG: glycosyltransferase [Verrucomicrobiota bacterium]|nr:glycosyltransferase [Verrucomicrobiota bacterium]
MKILVVTNLFPPHHAGTNDFRCQTVSESLRLRGHEVLVLTSSHGMKNEQRDETVERRLRLNGVFGDAPVKKFNEMKHLEMHNNGVLLEVIAHFQPDVIHVFSLHGLSKSLIFTLRNCKLPTVYDVSDFWLSADIREDPWLRFWNAPSVGLIDNSTRAALEMSGERGRLDSTAPTRMMKGYERLPAVFGSPKERGKVEPNSIAAFRFDRLYFCSEALKQLTERSGFRVGHGEVIYPGIPTEHFVGEIKTKTLPQIKFLILAMLNPESGVLTALKALQKTRAAQIKASLSIYGRGDSNYIAELRSFVVRQQIPVEFLNVSNLNTDMPAIYRKHDALLYTSEWAEPFSLVPLEAMASGLPVIGALSGGATELFRQGENALTYTPGNSDELASRMYELQFAPAMRCQIAETAQAEVLSKYNESTVTDQIENYLNTSQEIWSHTAT